MSYRREGDVVTITITRGQYESLLMALGMATSILDVTNPSSPSYESLLMALGMATGRALAEVGLTAAIPAAMFAEYARRFLRLGNAINEGNPDWTPYDVEPEASA